jgi:hypothetical protein
VADVARTDGNDAGMKSHVSDSPRLVLTSSLNEPANEYEPISNTENRKDEGKRGMQQQHQAEKNIGQTNPQIEKEDGCHETSRLPWVDMLRLGRLGVVDCHGVCTLVL